MDIGTAEIIEDIETPKRRSSSISSGPTSGGGNGPRNNGGGGGGDGPKGDKIEEPSYTASNKSRILTIFLLLVVLMTFGGLIAAYVVLATNKVEEWKPFTLPVQVWISTFIIIVSGLTYIIAERATVANDHQRSKRWFVITTALAVAFICSQILSWFELSRRGLYMQGNPYAGFFYILTAVHAVHVIGGIVALSTVLMRSWNPAMNSETLEYRKTLAHVVGWYWHFMGFLWIVLFLLLGFWK